MLCCDFFTFSFTTLSVVLQLLVYLTQQNELCAVKVLKRLVRSLTYWELIRKTQII